MTDWNLPPGCTNRMVDEAFGYKEGRRGVYTVTLRRVVYEEAVVEVEASSREDAEHDAMLKARTWKEYQEPDYDVEFVEEPDDGPDPDDERDARADYLYDRDR